VSVTLFLLLAVQALAQELPDPGRRLSREEMEGRAPPRTQKPRSAPRDPQACERSRTYYTMSCGAQGSRREFSKSCSEAYELYRQACS
jgi:hypothetical protein